MVTVLPGCLCVCTTVHVPFSSEPPCRETGASLNVLWFHGYCLSCYSIYTRALLSTFCIPQRLFADARVLFPGHDIPPILALLDREDDLFRRAIGDSLLPTAVWLR